MRKAILNTCLLLGSLPFIAFTAPAQEVVHALTGQLTAINTSTKTIHVDPDDGSEGLFKVLTKADTPLEFHKEVRAASTPVAAFNKTGSHVIVFYIGDDVFRTTVALKDLGDGPFVKATGAVVNLDKHAHTLTIRTASGDQSFHIDAKTVADATEGVVPGEKFPVDKGEQVRILAVTENGVQTALFIRSMSL